MDKYRILTLNKISSVGLRHFPLTHYVLGDDVAKPDAILVRSHNMHEMIISKSIKAIGRAGVGINNIPVAQMNLRGVPVFNTPGANANAVKELVVAAMLIAARNLITAINFANNLQGDTSSISKQVEEGKKHLAGIELANRTLGVVGLGAIGSIVADVALKLNMNVIGYDPKLTVDAAWRLPSAVNKAPRLEDLIKDSDIITLHTPLLDDTRNLINAERVSLMKHNTILLNFSREEMVEDKAVLSGLNNKKIKYYVCDFPSALLRDHPAVVSLPHLGASTKEAEDNCAIMVAKQIRDYLENGNIVKAVNFPDVEMARESEFRVGIANANVPNMLGKISNALGQAGLNIHNMVNKSKGEMAYTLVDVDSPTSHKTIKKIDNIRGVLMVRILPLENNKSK